MATITFNRFDLGIDHQKGAAVSDANRLIEIKNAHVTSGLATEKREGLTRVAVLESGTRGLFAANGVLNTFYCGAGDITHADTLFKAHKLTSTSYPDTALKDIPFVDLFNGYFYVAATHENGSTRHYYNGAEITDTNCPHTKVCYKAKSKIWAVGKDGDTVRYCKTSDCTNWSEADDAGFLPTGMNARGAKEIRAIGMYQNKMCFLTHDSVQVWTVDPDPTANSLDSIVENVGSSFSRSLATVSGDLYFLSDYGFRSITTYSLTYQLGDVDIGTPIDDIVRAVIRNRGDFEPLTIYFYGTGKYLCAIGRQVFVYSVSRTAKIAAWSRYELPVTVDCWAELEGVLYLRSGDTVYKLDEDAYHDDTGVLQWHDTVTVDNRQYDVDDETVVYNGERYPVINDSAIIENVSYPVTRNAYSTPVPECFEVVIQIPYMNFKKPGVLKQIYGIDIDIDGDCMLSIGTDSNTYSGKFNVSQDDCTITYDNSNEYFTDEVRVAGRTYSGGILPIECIGTEFSFRFRCENEKDFRLNALTVYYNDLGVV